MKIMLLSTDTPDNVINPTAAATDNGMCRSSNDTIPPTQPNGTQANTSSVSVRLR